MGVVMPLSFRASLVVLGAAALLSGCAPKQVTDRDGTIRLTLGDPEFAISPGSIKVRSGVIKIIARNKGKLTHNLRIEAVDDTEGATPKVYGSLPTMQPGQTAPSKTLRLSPGRYRLVCTIGNHENLGQYAELDVTRAGSGR
jgi:hypothetical protein